MARFFLSKKEIDTEWKTIVIRGEDARHISLSLRMAVGDPLTVCDMQKTEYHGTITEMTRDSVTVHIDGISENATELPMSVHLYQSVAKGEKMDYIVQKAVELGAASVTPVMSERCIVRLDSQKAAERCKRWQRIAEEAAKQCGRGMIPTVNPVISYERAIEESLRYHRTLFCYEGDGTVSVRQLLKPAVADARQIEEYSLAFFIGPEGGYSLGEVELAKARDIPLVNLGRRILRCETASGFVLSCIIYESELSE